MRVVFYSPGETPADWQGVFDRYLPGLILEDWETAPAGAEVAIAWKPYPALFAQQPQLKAMFALGAGVDALLPHCPAHVPLYRLENSGMAEQMADYVTRMVLDWFYYDASYRRQQAKKIWQPHALLNKAEWPITILGVGQLGQVVARRCQQLGFPVTGWRQQPQSIDGLPLVFGAEGLAQQLPKSKIIVNLLPLTTQTQNLINQDFLQQLPKGAYLINIARGAQVVEDDLLAALASGQLAGAALDVFREEPLPANHPLWLHPDVRITPHIAGITPMEEAAAQIAGKLQNIMAGKPASGLVDRLRGY